MNSDTSCGPAEFASAKTYRCEFCGNVNTDPARIEKCRELCRKIRAREERAAAAEPQTPEVLPAEKDAGPAAAAARGELLPRPMHNIPRPDGAPKLSVLPPPVPQFAKWARLGYRVCHEHLHGEPGKDPDVVILILAR